MLARNEIADYVADNYGTCDLGSGCYHSPNGCLRVGWRGRGCQHWHPVEGEYQAKLIAALSNGPLGDKK